MKHNLQWFWYLLCSILFGCGGAPFAASVVDESKPAIVETSDAGPVGLPLAEVDASHNLVHGDDAGTTIDAAPVVEVDASDAGTPDVAPDAAPLPVDDAGTLPEVDAAPTPVIVCSSYALPVVDVRCVDADSWYLADATPCTKVTTADVGKACQARFSGAHDLTAGIVVTR